MENFTYADELYHHGIKGMHWGVRRTPEELGNADYAKTAKKLHRFGNRIERNKRRSARFELKSAKYKNKALKAGNNATYMKRMKKAAKYEFKAAKANRRVTKYEQRGMKIAKKVANKYKDVPVNSINQDDYAYMQRWINRSWS